MRMTGGGLVAEVSAGHMLRTYAAMVVLMAVSHQPLFIHALADAAFAGHSMPRIDLASLWSYRT
jgi:hypothetical protein